MHGVVGAERVEDCRHRLGESGEKLDQRALHVVAM